MFARDYKQINETVIKKLREAIDNLAKDERYEHHREYCLNILNLLETDVSKMSTGLYRYLKNIFYLDFNSKTFNNSCLSIDNYEQFEENILSGDHDEILKIGGNNFPAVEAVIVNIKDETSVFIDEHYRQHQPKSARNIGV